MIRLMIFFAGFLTLGAPMAIAATPRAADFVSPAAYNTMYPAMNNKMRTNLNSGATPDFSPNSVSTLTRTSGNDNRRVVSRAARVATNSVGAAVSAAATTTARAGIMPTAALSAAAGNQNRRVVSRSGRTENIVTRTEPAVNSVGFATNESLPADRCLADYVSCMNGYCERENLSYNRCYCSSRLSQIEAQYQPAIDELIKQLLVLGSDNTWTDDEMNQYWEDTIVKYTGNNSWTNLDNALAIDWSTMESRARGQTAFITGHDYCVQHLRGCAYMSSNMRDAYRSEISRDCQTYENSLQKIKNAAESMISSYDD